MNENLRDYLRVKEAAELVGISPSTLRNWERAGKITAYRNPINGYRLFRKRDLQRLLADIQLSVTRVGDVSPCDQGRQP